MPSTQEALTALLSMPLSQETLDELRGFERQPNLGAEDRAYLHTLYARLQGGVGGGPLSRFDDPYRAPRPTLDKPPCRLCGSVIGGAVFLAVASAIAGVAAALFEVGFYLKEGFFPRLRVSDALSWLSIDAQMVRTGEFKGLDNILAYGTEMTLWSFMLFVAPLLMAVSGWLGLRAVR